jgi:hypothetical protein
MGLPRMSATSVPAVSDFRKSLHSGMKNQTLNV